MSATIERPQGWNAARPAGTVDRSPAWKDAVGVFLAAGFEPGQVIDHRWFLDQFGLLSPADCPDYTTSREAQLAYMLNIEGLKRELLEEYQIALRSVPGKGYEVVAPQEQTEWAEGCLRNELRKAMHTSQTRLVNLRLDELTDTQKKQNLDAQAKLSFFRKQARKALL